MPILVLLASGCGSFWGTVSVDSDPPGAVVYGARSCCILPFPMIKRGITPCTYPVTDMEGLIRTRVIWPDGTKSSIKWKLGNDVLAGKNEFSWPLDYTECYDFYFEYPPRKSADYEIMPNNSTPSNPNYKSSASASRYPAQQTDVAQPSSAANDSSVIEKLRKLKQMKDEGILTDDEYEQRRKALVEKL